MSSAELDAAAEPSWDFAPGDQMSEDLQAWALLGDGRRCETWLAWSAAWCGPVTVKLPRPGEVDARTRQLLAAEGALVGELNHPGLQRLLEFRAGPHDFIPHLVFEYVEGPTLGDLLDDEGALAPPDVLRLGMQVAATLHYLHGRGLTHLDLKPDNLLLRSGRAVLMDFDIALPVGARRPGRDAWGTDRYMAPEQRRLRPAAPGMDLWALGAVLLHAATGVAPEPPRPDLAAAPPALRPVLAALLHPWPSRRPDSATSALHRLEAALPAGEPGLRPDWLRDRRSS